jgi:serine-type D-Ala-D-Ala carboxypeptidase/endopeptidase (penicillin-binding protein 4)
MYFTETGLLWSLPNRSILESAARIKEVFPNVGTCYDQKLALRARSCQASMKKSIPLLTIAILLSGLFPLLALAQQTPPTSLPAPSPQPVITTPGPVVTQASTDASQARPLYGVQGVLVQTLDGRTISSQNEDQGFNPASAVKLATALVALRTLGPKHRFSTGIWTDGLLDKSTGTINGSLYISGRDPSLHYEQAVDIARQLNGMGIRTVTGGLVVSPDFTLNFDWSARRSGEAFYDTLDLQLRSAEATRAWLNARTALGDKTVVAPPTVAVMGEVTVGPVAPRATLLLTHSSSTLRDILKVLLCYSNNFMAERLGESLGGVQSVQRQLVTSLGIPEDQIHLSSLSGLGINRVTPNDMMKILRALRQEVQKTGMSLSHIMPVAGVDPGTLEDRFTSIPWRASVIAKTGTLVRTDGGASSLVGQMRTTSGEVLLFVIMNQNGNVWRFRENQDLFVMQIQNSRGGPRAFDYVPTVLAMKLAETRSKVGSADEFEPKTTVTNSP